MATANEKPGRLGGQVALITGAAQGLGEAIARKFVDHGAYVVIADIQGERGEALASELGAAAMFQYLNVCEPDSWEIAVGQTIAQFGGVDILVNNAGGAAGASAIASESVAHHEHVLRLNVTGTWGGVRAVVRPMTAGGGGSIVNISSIDGIAGAAGMSTYCAAKFAVTGLTRSLALELGPHGIRVNAVHPGIMSTPPVEAVRGLMKARLEKAVARQPLARMGRPDEVANAVLFFASSESSYCTGASLLVDGGHLAGPYRDPLAEPD
jgi:3alpha(or 20beta)-hydroxysteroid dehydrogenase